MGRLRKLIPRFSLRTLAIFTLLCTSEVGLWWRWEPWAHSLDFRADGLSSIDDAAFSGAGERVLIVGIVATDIYTRLVFRRVNRLYDARTGRLLAEAESPLITDPDDWQKSPPYSGPFGKSEVTVCGRWDGPLVLTCLLADSYAERFVLEAHGVKMLLEHHDEVVLNSGAGWGPGAPCGAFSADNKSLVIAGPVSTVTVYRRRRPEWWWGVFYLWEFWLTAAFAGLFVWSVWRDRRSLRARPEPTQ